MSKSKKSRIEWLLFVVAQVFVVYVISVIIDHAPMWLTRAFIVFEAGLTVLFVVVKVFLQPQTVAVSQEAR